MNEVILALDLGGTWMKGCASPWPEETPFPVRNVRRIRTPLEGSRDADGFAAAVAAFCRELAGGGSIRAIVAATAGEVDAQGKRYLCAGAHLGVMGSTPWGDRLEARLSCPVTLINDAEAFLLGAAVRHLVPDQGAVGALVLGTGLGFAMARDGRWWRPNRRLIHLGAILCADGDFNAMVSAVRASEEGVFSEGTSGLAAYLGRLSAAIATAVNLFQLDTVLLGGGGVDALQGTGIDWLSELKKAGPARLLPRAASVSLVPVDRANQVILEGTLTLARGNAHALQGRAKKSFRGLGTERGGFLAGMETRSPVAIAARLCEEEAAAAGRLSSQAEALARGASLVADTVRRNGRVFYVGAGTSGRLGALDAVEIPCTFGVERRHFQAIIAGGVSDAALTIEGGGEEDVSSVPDLILAGLQAGDLVVGITASATAYFVRSALAFARSRGAATILVHENPVEAGVADLSIRLESGAEPIAGSTRMKAGTATKKVLNALSTVAMVLLGKVREGEMIDLDCNNEKLRERAVRILSSLRRMPEESARELLKQNGFQLRAALESKDPLRRGDG
jgi:N-acetylmuramic acid 6-phosphate etherase